MRKNSPQTSVVVTCSLKPLAERIPEEKMLLKLPDSAAPSFLNIIEKVTKHKRKIKKSIPLTVGENENNKPSFPGTGRNFSYSVESGANKIPCELTDKYSKFSKLKRSESD